MNSIAEAFQGARWSDSSQCKRKKFGEFNMLRCASSDGHSGDCCFVVDRGNDYPHNKKRGKEKNASPTEGKEAKE